MTYHVLGSYILEKDSINYLQCLLSFLFEKGKGTACRNTRSVCDNKPRNGTI